MSRLDTIHRAVLAALGHVKPDYRSASSLDETAKTIAEFVESELSLGQVGDEGHQTDYFGPQFSNTIPGARMKPKLLKPAAWQWWWEANQMWCDVKDISDEGLKKLRSDGYKLRALYDGESL